jgi:hypothetical protein
VALPDNPVTFEQFWDHYVAAHKKKGTRALHFVGTTAAGLCLAGGLLTKRRWLLLVAPVVGYGSAWIGHFFIEGNKPATFEHPLWSLRGDMLMWWKTLTGQMQAEVDRVVRLEAEPAPESETDGAFAQAHERSRAGEAVN